jgi:hypothetical protein
MYLLKMEMSQDFFPLKHQLLLPSYLHTNQWSTWWFLYSLQTKEERINEAAQKLQQSISTKAWLQRTAILKLHMIWLWSSKMNISCLDGVRIALTEPECSITSRPTELCSCSGFSASALLVACDLDDIASTAIILQLRDHVARIWIPWSYQRSQPGHSFWIEQVLPS